MPVNPYSTQLAGFTGGVPNARRALKDVYRKRVAQTRETKAGLGSLYAGSVASSRGSTQRGLSAIASSEGDAWGLLTSSGYGDLGGQQGSDLRAIIQRGSRPYGDYLRQVGGAEALALRGYGRADQGEQTLLRQGIQREMPAALAELERGIVEGQTALQAQAAGFASQQNLLQQQMGYLGQLTNAAQGGQGGLSAAEQWIIGKESGPKGVTADNPTSTAFGLGQLLLSNRQKYAAQLGVSPSTTDYSAQLQMMRMYIEERYGTAEAAMRFWQTHGWY